MSTTKMGPDWLDQRIQNKEVVVIDGGMGTELERRGMPMDATGWCGLAQFSHPDLVRTIHEDYIRAGADVIIANTFATARNVLEPMGYGERVAEANRKAVELAKQARESAADRPIAIAGSISNMIADSQNHDFIGKVKSDSKWRRPEVLRATYREIAETLAESGVDLIALEMIQRIELLWPTVEAAVATGLPVWIGLSVKRRKSDQAWAPFEYDDVSALPLFDETPKMGAGLIAVMHSPVHDTGPGLTEVKKRWRGPLGAYPESGGFVMPNWQFKDIVSPGELAEAARGWVAQGCQIVGGCCGTGVEHVRALKSELPAKLPA